MSKKSFDQRIHFISMAMRVHKIDPNLANEIYIDRKLSRLPIDYALLALGKELQIRNERRSQT